MATIEQVEKLRQHANVTYDEARAALDASGGDLLEAMILLEKQGKVPSPAGGGFCSSDGGQASGSRGEQEASGGKEKARRREPGRGETFGELMGRFFRFCCKIIYKGNVNTFEVFKDGESKAAVPITVLVLLLIFLFWVTLPLIIIGLFFGLRYRFCGPDFDKCPVNGAMEHVADAAEKIKQSVREQEK